MRNADIEAAVDSIMRQNGRLTVNGSAAQRLLANQMNVSALRTNALLRKDEWKHYDMAIVKVALERLNGIADLESRGLVYTLANGLGKTVLEYEDMSDVEAADMDMTGVAKSQNDRVEFDINYLPLPLIHADYQINVRMLNASRTSGDPLDTTLAEAKAGKVAEKLEETLFNGSSTFTFGGGTIYGYTDFPHRTTGTLTAAWSTATGAQIVGDVLDMKQDAINDRHYGPYVLYIPTAYETALDDNYVAGYPTTVRERILAISNVDDIKTADKLTAGQVLLVQMSSETVRLVKGLPVTNVEWTTEGGMVSHFKIMTIQVPQIRADQNDRSGIVHYSAP